MVTAVSLFSGCGGSDTGLVNSGVEILLANDIGSYAKDTYLANLPETEYILGDIKNIESFPSADLLVGCYPCQGFSQGGNRDPDKAINGLYKDFSRALGIVKPKAFIVENVSGMTRQNFQGLFNSQIRSFRSRGYRVSYQVLNAADYGVPQERKRIFIVGIKSDVPVSYTFPSPTHGSKTRKNFRTIRNAIGDMPDWPKGEFYDVDFHWYYLSRDRRRDWDLPSKTVLANPRHTPLHPISPVLVKKKHDVWQFESNKPARRFSYRETARLQGFSKHFKFPETDNATLYSKYKVVGNAVPPPLFQSVFEAIPDIW